MSNPTAFAQVATNHRLNADRVEAARLNGLSMTTLVKLLTARPALEVDAMLVPLSLGQQSHDELAAQAEVLSAGRW